MKTSLVTHTHTQNDVLTWHETIWRRLYEIMSVSAWHHKHTLLHSCMLVFNQRIIAPPLRSPTLSPNGINHSLIQQPKFSFFSKFPNLSKYTFSIIYRVGWGYRFSRFLYYIYKPILLLESNRTYKLLWETVERPKDQLWKGSLAKVQNLLRSRVAFWFCIVYCQCIESNTSYTYLFKKYDGICL